MRKLDISGMIAVGNGEPCPFCKEEDDRLVDDVFIMAEGKNILEHMLSEHPSELNKAVFSDPPPKPWLEQDFTLVIAKIATRLKNLEESGKVSEEAYEESLHNMFGVMQDFFKETNNESD